MKFLSGLAALVRPRRAESILDDHRWNERAAMRKLDMHMDGDVDCFIAQLNKVKGILSDRRGFDASKSRIALAVQDLSDRIATTSVPRLKPVVPQAPKKGLDLSSAHTIVASWPKWKRDLADQVLRPSKPPARNTL